MDLCLRRYLQPGRILPRQPGRQDCGEPARHRGLARHGRSAYVLHRGHEEARREDAGVQGRDVQERRRTVHPHRDERGQPPADRGLPQQHVGPAPRRGGRQPQTLCRQTQRPGRHAHRHAPDGVPREERAGGHACLPRRLQDHAPHQARTEGEAPHQFRGTRRPRRRQEAEG